ncbi:MAG: ribokinase [Actinobacteria bacterium]|nr:ribokinase [Actinomycetota bacterium]
MIVGVGTICVDIIAFMDRFPEIGETVKGDKVGLFPGGKVSNATIMTARLAEKFGVSYMIGKWGKDFYAPICKKHFREMLVNTKYCKYGLKNTNTPLIYVNKYGENMIVCTPGASSELSRDDIDKALPILKNCKVCILESGIPFEISEYVANIVRQNGGETVFIPAPAQGLTPEFLSSFDYVLPNETEAKEISGVEIKDELDIYKSGRLINEKGVRNVIITASDKGAYFINKDKEILIPSYKVKTVDPTGAGDSFAGGLAYGLYKGLNIENSIRLGNVTGALAVTKLGAGTSIPSRTEVLQFIKEKKIRKLENLI